MSTSDITSVFTEGVALGTRAIRNRTHFKKNTSLSWLKRLFMKENCVALTRLRLVQIDITVQRVVAFPSLE